jgi:hypothetical protein
MAENELIDSGTTIPPEAAPVSQPSDAGADVPAKISLRDELKKNFNELREPKELRSKPDKQVDKPAALADGRLRDETGKFLPKEAAEKTPNKTVEAKTAPVETAPKVDASPAPASVPPGLPPGWSPETKAFVNTLPADHPLRKDVEKREKEISDGFKKYSDDAKRYSEIEQVLAPVRSVFQQAGARSDAEAINRLLSWEAAIRQNPAQAIPALARQYGVDLASLAQNPGSNQTPPDAAVQLQQYVQQAIQPVQSELQRIQSERAASEIAQFSKDKPYFEKVKVQMGQLMAQGAAADLDKAYQMAIWSDPETRAELIQKETDAKLATSQQAQADQVQRSQAAKRAAVSPSTRAPAAAQVNGKDHKPGVRGSILKAIADIREERA